MKYTLPSLNKYTNKEFEVSYNFKNETEILEYNLFSINNIKVDGVGTFDGVDAYFDLKVSCDDIIMYDSITNKKIKFNVIFDAEIIAGNEDLEEFDGYYIIDAQTIDLDEIIVAEVLLRLPSFYTKED